MDSVFKCIYSKKFLKISFLVGIILFINEIPGRNDLSGIFAVGEDKKNPSTKNDGWERLILGAGQSGKPGWRPMLKYVAELHRKSTHPAMYPFDYEWEEIGPGYTDGPAFGHVDITHQSLDVMNFYPEHALHQLLNNIKNQEPNGIIPGVISMPAFSSKGDSASWKKNKGYPPLWVIAVQDYLDLTSDKSKLPSFFSALIRQITWFENSRKSTGRRIFLCRHPDGEMGKRS